MINNGIWISLSFTANCKGSFIIINTHLSAVCLSEGILNQNRMMAGFLIVIRDSCSSYSLLLTLIILALQLKGGLVEGRVDNNRAPGNGGPSNIEKEPENLIHPPCTRCAADEFYEVENSFDLFPPGHCFGMDMPNSLSVKGLAMV